MMGVESVIATFISGERDRKSAIKVFKMAVGGAGFYPKIVAY